MLQTFLTHEDFELEVHKGWKQFKMQPVWGPQTRIGLLTLTSEITAHMTEIYSSV